jgi:hypothetical protein
MTDGGAMAGFFSKLMRKALGIPAPAAPASRAVVQQQLQQQAQKIMTPERQELLRRAMEIQGAKQKIFDALSDDKKKELVALAMRSALKDRPATAAPKRRG